MNLQSALGIVRLLIENGVSREEALRNPAIPEELRAQLGRILDGDDTIVLRPVSAISARPSGSEWLHQVDRSSWYYWPRLREYLLGRKGRSTTVVRALDEQTDRILGLMSPPSADEFDTRGLVLGFVQSGKTANYSALIAKAADVGYRLVVVLTGMDKGLRRQTQIRLKKELVGYTDNRLDAVRLPPVGLQWHEFTSDELEGDFQPGNANQAALQGSQPVLLVVKKNGPVLRKLIGWLDRAADDVKRNLPVLVVDDEADQASVDTRGTYQQQGQPLPSDYDEPSVINGLIRDLLNKFDRRAYVAYTATPYANILIPHDTYDVHAQNDLYPKDFIVDLPKPPGYFGAEELFGKYQPQGADYIDGLDVIREVSSQDLVALDQGQLPTSLAHALETFVLGGAARAERGNGDAPATMLIHISRLRIEQGQLANLVRQYFMEMRDEWRYQRTKGIRSKLEARWNSEFRPLIQARYVDRDRDFTAIEDHIGPFLEAAEVRVINSDTGEVLDYERQPKLKAIAIGGNRLSRGLTLEGLLVSYFARESETYDTLMQMGRWFGFRGGYEDLTRIFTTNDLEQWFADLAFVESQLREDLKIYEEQGLTPREVGLRIWQHPVMEVTSRLKRRFASRVTISESFSGTRPQTFKFPLSDLDALAELCEGNRQAVIRLVRGLGDPVWGDNRPSWSRVKAASVLNFLSDYQTHPTITGLSLPLIQHYIQLENEGGRLVDWTVAIRGLTNFDKELGIADWSCLDRPVNLVERTRISNTDSLGVITAPRDETLGLSEDEQAAMRARVALGDSDDVAARHSRAATKGLLLIYPISKHSGVGRRRGTNRRPLYENPGDVRARDLIAIAISFPDSPVQRRVEAYLEGTVGWQPV